MAKTEVILLKNVAGLGAESDQVKVAAGYARNYLFPQRIAVPLTLASKRQIEVLRRRRHERETHELNTMTELAHGLSRLTLTITVKTGDDGKLFGSVTSGTIADELKHQFDATVDKRKIHLPNAIKNVGDYEVELRLHPEVTATLKVRVKSDNPLPEPSAAAPAESKKEGKKDETAAPKRRSKTKAA